MTKQAGKLDLNWMQTAGSALAALSSAVLLSTLGATGTLVGAALGSIVVTVGGTVYSHCLAASRARMARSAVLVRAARPGGDRSRGTATAGIQAVTRAIAESPERFPLLAASAKGVAPPSTSTPRAPISGTPTSGAPGQRLIDGNLPGTPLTLRQMLRGLRWKPALAASLGVFVLVMGMIVSMELATGRALSSYTGGSSADGPRTSIALLGSTTDTGGSDSTTTDPDKSADRGTAGSGGTNASDARARSAGDTADGSTSGSGSDTGASQPDTSRTEPDAGEPTEPAPRPTPDTPTEPAPEPTTAPSTQAPAPAPTPAPAPSTSAAVSSSVADQAS